MSRGCFDFKRTGQVSSIVRGAVWKLILDGVRYRFANGLRQAMRLWGAVIVLVVVAIGLDAQPNLGSWIRAWRASQHPTLIAFAAAFAFAVLLRSVLQRALRAHGQRDFILLPLSPMQRAAIDGGSILLFMAIPYGCFLAFAATADMFGRSLVAVAAAVAFLFLTLGGREERSASASGLAIRRTAAPNELRWLFRAGGVAGALAFAVITILGAHLAIENNAVSSTHAAARIHGVFAAIAALVVAVAIVRARTAMRPFRAVESTLPLSSEARMRALCAGALILAAPLLLSGLAAPFAIMMVLSLVLLGEHFNLRGERREWELNVYGAAAAVAAAIDMRVATAAAAALVAYAWSLAVASDRVSDAPVLQEVE